MSRRCLARCAILSFVAVGAATGDVAGEPFDCSAMLSVTPAQPGCTDAVGLHVTVILTDSCWSLEPPVFLDERPDFAFEILTVDTYQPPAGCVFVVLELPFAQTVGPLPPGPYALAVTHRSTSPRFGDAVCTGRKTFDVTCCPDLPAGLTDLRVSVAAAGTEIRLHWDDVPDADDYVVYGALEPDGAFTQSIQTAVSGAGGAGLPVATAPSFFLVAARNGCGVGPRR